MAREFFWVLEKERTVLMVERPQEVYHNQGQAHRLGGPAIRFRDGAKFFFLNGKKVSQEEVMAAKEQ